MCIYISCLHICIYGLLQFYIAFTFSSYFKVILYGSFKLILPMIEGHGFFDSIVCLFVRILAEANNKTRSCRSEWKELAVLSIIYEYYIKFTRLIQWHFHGFSVNFLIRSKFEWTLRRRYSHSVRAPIGQTQSHGVAGSGGVWYFNGSLMSRLSCITFKMMLKSQGNQILNLLNYFFLNFNSYFIRLYIYTWMGILNLEKVYF